MGRHQKAVRYKKTGKYWYYKTPEMTSFKTTGEVSKTKAENYVVLLVKKNQEGDEDPLFRVYAEPFFDWERCPHVKRLLSEGKHITQRYCIQQRRWLEKYVFNSEFGKRRLSAIKRGTLLDFRSSLLTSGVSINNVNGIMKAVTVIINEAFYREDIAVNPALGLGKLKPQNREAGTFSVLELQRLFNSPLEYCAWETPTDYICFLIAALTGMRCSEILALKWCNVHTNEKYIHICEAWKNQAHTELGLPKSNKVRDVILHPFLIQQIEEFRNCTVFNSPESLVVCEPNGTPYPVWKWQTVFRNALVAIGISDEERIQRHLKPHSFRHTLNTILRERGADPYLIRLMLGWSDSNIQQNYTHVDIVRMIKNGDLTEAIFNDLETPLIE